MTRSFAVSRAFTCTIEPSIFTNGRPCISVLMHHTGDDGVPQERGKLRFDPNCIPHLVAALDEVSKEMSEERPQRRKREVRAVDKNW